MNLAKTQLSPPQKILTMVRVEKEKQIARHRIHQRSEGRPGQEHLSYAVDMDSVRLVFAMGAVWFTQSHEFTRPHAYHERCIFGREHATRMARFPSVFAPQSLAESSSHATTSEAEMEQAFSLIPQYELTPLEFTIAYVEKSPSSLACIF